MLDVLGPYPLAGYLHQSELGERQHRMFRLVAGHELLHGLIEFLTVLRLVQVDEIDDDETSHVAQPELAGYLFGRHEIHVHCGALLVVGHLGTVAAVHVYDIHRLRMLDDEIRPTLERNVFGKERLYLARNIVMVENGNLALVQLHYLLLFRRDDLDILPHFVVHLLVIHYDGTERTVQRIAQDGIGPIHLAEQQRRRFERLDIPKHLLPFIDKGSYILTYIRFVLALRGGTYYHTVILGQYRQGYLLEPLALFRRANLLGDGNLVRERNEHHVPPCKGDVRRKPGSFRGPVASRLAILPVLPMGCSSLNVSNCTFFFFAPVSCPTSFCREANCGPRSR